MQQTTKPLLISRYFRIYTLFLNIDVETAILEGRDFNIINLFRINLELLFEKNVEIKKANQSLKALEELIKEERAIYNSISIYNNNDFTYSLIRNGFEECYEYFIEFFEAYEFVYNVFEGDEGRKFQDILVEFNNALSHLIAFAYNHNETNIKKAISHLYRGILDCYKEIIHKNYDIVKENDQIIKQLDDKTYLQYYIDLRKEEASNIGADEAIKKDNILKGYKQLSWLLVE